MKEVVMLALSVCGLIGVSVADCVGEMEIDEALNRRYMEWNEYLEHRLDGCIITKSRIDSGEFYDNDNFRRIVALGSHAVPGILRIADSDRSILEAASQITKWKYHVVRTGDTPDRYCWHVLEFPILMGRNGPPDLLSVWNYWWRAGRFQTGELFERLYGEWKSFDETRKERAKIYRRIVDLGLPVLPYLVGIVRAHSEFIAAISELSDGALPATATPEECEKWWEKNKAAYTLPGTLPDGITSVDPKFRSVLQ